MDWTPIQKVRKPGDLPPNLADYAAERASFSWDAVRSELTGLPGGGLNIAYEALDRHVAAGRGDTVAIRWLGRKGERQDLRYRDLTGLSGQFANVLDGLGVGAGERVFALASRIVELYVAALGALRHRSVFCPLFSAFGPEPILQRMTIGDAAVLVTTAPLYQRKVAPIRDQLPGLRHILIAGLAKDVEPPAGTLNLAALMGSASDEFPVPPTGEEDLALLHFTSGTTGKPKGAMHVHEAVVAHYATGRYALDLRPGDIFWCTADPGWVTGTSYGIIAPLVIGATMIVDEAEFDAARWYQVLQDEAVDVWYTAPTAIRMLMKAGTTLAGQYQFPRLRFIASVGEPLNPECVAWGLEALSLPIHDNWWQTETGGIMVANFASMEIRYGSMGRPLPGIDVAVVQRGETDGSLRICTDGEEGELALRKGWPSMFRGYLHEEERYARCFAGDWYLTGDLARIDDEGYVWFVGRADDVIKTSGHLIGPFEVESILMEHPAVLEAGVIGKPDAIAGAVVKAFVALKPGRIASDDLMLDILGFARKRLGPAVAPKEIEFAASLPKTRSGKIMR
ncbi:MAG: acetate--CoA ligase, partial [Dehalococcoidia bacterium]